MRACSKCHSNDNVYNSGWCRRCHTEYYRNKNKVKSPRVDISEDLRKCSRCAETKDLEEYPKNKSCSKGRERVCKSCVYGARDKKLQKKLRRKWYLENRDLTIKRAQEHYFANQEDKKAYARRYHKENPHVAKAAFHRRRARMEENGQNDLTAEQIAELKNKHSRCFYCLKPKDDLVVEHMTPLSRGGCNTLTNITIACASCNNSKRSKTVDEFLEVCLI